MSGIVPGAAANAQSLHCAHPEFDCNLRGRKTLRFKPLEPGVRVRCPKTSGKVAHFSHADA
jgi:hypothetical protein